jgi:thiol-disulfide isomerase/thioredoxin
MDPRLVEFFSPFCPHCTKFAPTWKKIADAHKDLENNANFYMAQVNCIASGGTSPMVTDHKHMN